MSNTNETIVDIVAELRNNASDFDSADPRRKMFNHYADRIEAAREREREKLSSCYVRSTHEAARIIARSGEVNAAKMYKALVAVSKAFDDSLICTDRQMSMDECDRLDEVRHKVKSALAKPPRNCDHMGVDDAFSAFSFMCDNTNCSDCPYKSRNRFGDRELCAMLFLYDNGGKEQEGGEE